MVYHHRRIIEVFPSISEKAFRDYEHPFKGGWEMMEKPKRRDPIRIVFELLKNARNPIKKTNLQHLTGISGNELNKYLSTMLERGLIQEVPFIPGSGRFTKLDLRTPYLYATTVKGVEFIGLFDRIYDILGIEGG